MTELLTVDRSQLKQTIIDRVNWWLKDMAFKPPEVLTEYYFDTMAEDIARWAVNEPPVAYRRLDPPKLVLGNSSPGLRDPSPTPDIPPNPAA